MNLTFYQNNKEKENINLYTNFNFYPRTKGILFPSIFSHYESDKVKPDEINPKKIRTKIYLPIYRNIKKELLRMKIEVNSMFNIKNTIFTQMKSRFNSIIYKNFVKGLGKYFFGPYGIVTKRYKFLKEYYIHKSILNQKIYVGKLEYFNIPIKKYNQVTARENEAKKKRLSHSTNFAVVFDKNDVISVKAVTSKRLVNYKKNFVDINRSKYLSNNLQQINEVDDVKEKKNKAKLKYKKKIKLLLNTNKILNKIKEDNKKNENKKDDKGFTFITEYNKNIDIKKLRKNLTSKTPKNIFINFKNKRNIHRNPKISLTQNNFNSKI